MKTAAIRLILTAVLLVGVYGETGPWTTLALALTFLGFESVTYQLRRRDDGGFPELMAALRKAGNRTDDP